MDFFSPLRLPLSLNICNTAKDISNCAAGIAIGTQTPSSGSSHGSLRHVLEKAAANQPTGRIILYKQGDVSTPAEVTYAALYDLAQRMSLVVQSLDGFVEGSPVLLHLPDHWDMILWFWAVVLADGVPVPSSPFSNVPEHRRSHIQGLSELLESPVCITRQALLHQFDGSHTLQLSAVETLAAMSPEPASPYREPNESSPSDLAILTLTSGSTGSAKAVRLTHRQVMAAVSGKSMVRELPKDKPFLNWIGLDHVASLVEIHIQALYLQVDQVHVHASDVVASPLVFLDLLSRHQVSRSFAPNFFLGKLISNAGSGTEAFASQSWDLSNLVILASGGEANEVDTCVQASRLLHHFGARPDVITPGFGMTETCAGAIFSVNCPRYDMDNNNTFASVGKCMKGIDMRVTLPTSDGRVMVVGVNEPGDLEVRGEVVFEGYYRNGKATAEAFTPDRWFRTGDQATIDANGNLNLIGRAKEVMNINGVKINSIDIQNSIEKAVGALVARVVSFPSRSSKACTEQVTVAYIPNEWPVQSQDMVTIDHKIVQACVMVTGSRPFVFPLCNETLLPKTTLGKISKAKMRTLFESGAFANQIEAHENAVNEHRQRSLNLPASVSEARLIDDFVEVLGIARETIGVDTPIFEMGFTSLDLIRLKRQIDNRLQFNLPVITIMKNPTARLLATALRNLDDQAAGSELDAKHSVVPYDPVVTLCPTGKKTPLWLVHPGVGEVLVFVGLAQQMVGDDRPVYALRARGFESGHPNFGSITETVSAYHAAIRERQPEGPYAIAGYSYGTMLAFEVAKKLEVENGAEVKFLGSFNLPPHIKSRMRQLNWNLCLLHLSYFLELIPETYADSLEDRFPNMPREEAFAIVMSAADKERMAELGLDESKLTNWAELAFGLQGMAVNYEPSGSVATIDVFHAIPLRVAAKSREDWVENHLSKWKDFSRGEARFHEVGGAHYTMIGPQHVVNFATTLKAALRERGL
ncbi:hypothetical protein S40285_03621 [Stachybotrys chlorohalonatus IBT 40285]|uniref:Carrier domain-containing protein n=1 Tax=Stachybotrys chlorohalonatus (strain IBT 40285) TaxID=1283841 RepID=A0A084QBQ8_STAC4|nr:hypothetical protein S40285_03621 [Stachybotrys chlorohalonata IBT 40285]